MPREGSWPTVAEFLADRTGDRAGVSRRLAAGEVRLGDGAAVGEHTAYRPGELVWTYRDLPAESPPPESPTVLHRDDDLVVVDKPHFMATMPRGRHVAHTVLLRLRDELGLPELAPAHRLDRLTAGVLLLTARRTRRAAYQQLFATRSVRKTYLAVAPVRDDLAKPALVASRILKDRGSLQAREVAGEPNARTGMEFLDRRGDLGLYRLRPLTGRTHQLRVHLSSLGVPIVGDPLYPQVIDVAPDDFTRPLQLLAETLAFADPVTGLPRSFRTRRSLAWPPTCRGMASAGAQWSGVQD